MRSKVRDRPTEVKESGAVLKRKMRLVFIIFINLEMMFIRGFFFPAKRTRPPHPLPP